MFSFNGFLSEGITPFPITRLRPVGTKAVPTLPGCVDLTQTLAASVNECLANFTSLLNFRAVVSRRVGTAFVPTGRGLCALAGSMALATTFAVTDTRAQSNEVKRQAFQSIGRAATPAEIKAWNIDVRPDFQGLPAGRGSVAEGEALWEKQCASCHGVFGESNEVFPPLIGGTTQADQARGRVASLTSDAQPVRTTLMKLSSLATLWDYINRAMPWNAPKSLSINEVYAVTAFMLNLGDIVPADFVLSDENIRATQAKLPNRNGMTQAHGLWLASGKADVAATECMKNCAVSTTVVSTIPDYAKSAHGNLADQMRLIGATRGIATLAEPKATPAAASAAEPGVAALALAQKLGCTACHGIDSKVLGPSFKDVRERYRVRADAASYLAKRIAEGSGGVWGNVPMPPMASIAPSDIEILSRWLSK